MTISPWLFFGLLLLAIAPAYFFAFYGLYAVRATSRAVSKLVAQDLSHSIGALQGGGQPIYSTQMSMQDLAKLVSKEGEVKKEGEAAPVAHGHYL